MSTEKKSSYTIKNKDGNLEIKCPITEISLLRKELADIVSDNIVNDAKELIKQGEPYTNLSAKYNCSKTNIFKLLHRKGLIRKAVYSFQ